MRKRLVVRALLTAALITAAPTLTGATDHQEVHAWWETEPDSDQSHPNKIKVAMVVDEGLDLTACHLWYEHVRYTDSGSGTFPAISGTGRMKVILKISGPRGKRRIAKYAREVPPGEPALLGWADSPMQNQYLALQYGLKTKRSGKFPVRAEAGDMILWTLKFSGMPAVEIEREGAAPFSDYLWAWTWCESCGTKKRPCPDNWTNDD